MLGAVIGDLAGSIYEYEQVKTHKKIEVKNIIEDNSFISDDTILTVAVLDAVLSGRSYEEKLREYALKYSYAVPNVVPYFKTMFSPGFISWANGSSVGESFGNGAMMRISPVGYLFDVEEDVIKNAYLATVPSHNTKEALDCAKIVALVIFFARHGYKKEDIIKKLNLKIKKPVVTKFNYSCKDTIDLCLYSVFNATSFEDSLRLALLFGGDTDTNAAIVGSMAEAMFGIREELKELAMQKLPDEFKEILNNGYEKINKINDNEKM